MLDWLSGKNILTKLDAVAVLEFLSKHGCVDGVTRENTLTEDGLPAQDGIDVLARLHRLINDYR